jgi:hypothetical protein
VVVLDTLPSGAPAAELPVTAAHSVLPRDPALQLDAAMASGVSGIETKLSPVLPKVRHGQE